MIRRSDQIGEAQALYNAYKRSLELAAENGCCFIGFPLIPAGTNSYPLKEAWKQAVQACQYFNKYVDHSTEIVSAVLDKCIINTSLEVISKMKFTYSGIIF